MSGSNTNAGRPWLAHYDSGVPHTLEPYPQKTLLDIVAEAARQRPHHTALIFKGSRISYGKLEQLSSALAWTLIHRLGIQKGDRIALLLPNCPQFIIGQFGIWKAGGIAVPINPLYTREELKHTLTECGANTALVLTPFYEKVKAIQPATDLRQVIATNIKEYLPTHLSLAFTFFKEKKEGHRTKIHKNDYWLHDLLKEGSRKVTDSTVSPSDPALILFSGGTTGTPKGVLSNHHALLMSGMQIRAWFAGVLNEWDDVLALVMPLFHVYANAGILAPGLIGHNPLSLVPNPRDLNDVLHMIHKTRPALLPGVPTLFIALLQHPKVQTGKIDLSAIKACIAGAAPLLEDTAEKFQAMSGSQIVEGYALTESMMAAVISPVHGIKKSGSVGLPLPDVEIRIADAVTGEGNLPQGEIGEILIGAPQLMTGYWGRPEETESVLRNGWLYTGDLGYLDEDGYLFIVDRKKDVIKPSGFQVWPREVEEVIASHPAVSEVGVAGVPDSYQGEAVKAWVVLREGENLTPEELQDHCRCKLIAYKVPKHIEFCESLPKSTVGKVLRRELGKSTQ